MSTLPAITVTPGQAATAYRNVDQGVAPDNTTDGTPPDFGAVLGRTLAGAVSTGRAAEQQAIAAVAGGGDLTTAVTALAQADLALQTTTAIRDRVVQAYQDIMKMPI